MKTAPRHLLWALAAALLGTAQAQVQAPQAPASAPARAASSAPSPATAAERARMPGELRPEQPVVPQIAVPLRRDGAAAPSERAASTVGGSVDDRTARCRAEKTKAARAACERRSASAAGNVDVRKR